MLKNTYYKLTDKKPLKGLTNKKPIKGLTKPLKKGLTKNEQLQTIYRYKWDKIISKILS